MDSKIILTDSKFRIIERIGNKVAKHSGKYELNDSILTLVFKRSSSLPVITSDKNISIASKSDTLDRQKVTIISAVDDYPSFLAEVVLRDGNGRIIKKMNPNFDGEVILKDLETIKHIEISSPIDARTVVIDFQKFKNKNIEVKLEKINWGGETFTNPDCGMVYSTQPIIVAKTEINTDKLIKIFIDEKVYMAEK